MLKPPTAYETNKALMMLIRNWCAWDNEAGIHMWASRGRRMTARPTRYIVAYDDYHGNSFRLTATSVEEAIDKANRRIERGALTTVVHR